MSSIFSRITLSSLLALSGLDASAAVVQTQGSGTAVTTVTHSADFELNAGLANPYQEGGIFFAVRNSSSLTPDSNQCGFAGCSFHTGFFPGFSGNYLYRSGGDIYISIRLADSSDFSAVEFVAGTGFNPPVYGYWQTYNNGLLTGSGNFSTAAASVIGLQDAAGFDEVRYFAFGAAGQSSGSSASAMDTVRIGTNVPPIADITGTITNSLGGGAMSGVSVANTGAPSTSTNGSGVYSFTGLAAGSYTITPSIYNYIFSPLSRTVNLAGSNATGQDFVGTYNAIPDTTTLRDLVIAANLTDTRLRNSLLAPLNAALMWLNGSDPNRVVNACSNLAKFISVVRQNVGAGKLPPATGDAWVLAANDILALSGCPTR